MNSVQSPIKFSPTYDASRELGAQFTDRAGWQVPAQFGGIEDELATARRAVALADNSANGKIIVEGTAAESVLLSAWAIPKLAIGQGSIIDSRRIYRLRDDQFFIHLEPGTEEGAIKAARDAARKQVELMTVTDVTHGLADLRLIGPRCTELLSRLCSLDFHPSQFPDLSARQSSVAKTRQLILRHDLRTATDGSIPAYSLIGARSLAIYLWQTIREAGHDLELGLIGQLALEVLAGDD